MKRRIVIFLIVVLMSFTLFAGGTGEAAETDTDDHDKIMVFVSILPQKYFAERIGGDRVEVKVMLPPGKSPATYEPTPRQVLMLGEAALFFTIGVPFENGFIHTIEESLPNLPIVETDHGISKRMLEAHEHEDEHEHEGEHEQEDEHEHEDEDEHHSGADPHIWMDPLLVKIQAENIRDALIEADPRGRDYYMDNFEDFAGDLDALHGDLEYMLESVRGSTLFVYHPFFGYFADRYGFEQVAIETGGREPSPAGLEEIIEHAAEEGVRVIFVQPEFPKSSAEAVARAIGGVVVPAAPLREDYIINMRELAEAVKEGLSK